MEQSNKNPIQAPDITGDLNKLNQVASQPDFTASKSQELNWGIPSTDELISSVQANTISNKPKETNPFLRAANASGIDSTVGLDIKEGKDLSKYKDYVANTGYGITTPDDLLDATRAANQSNWEQTGHALARVATNILPEIAQQVTRMVDFSNNYESDYAIAQYMQEIKDANNEKFNIYRDNPGQAFDFGDYAYWMDQGSNIATSALAFAAIGYATGGISGLGIAKLGRIGTAAVEGAGSLGLKFLPNAIQSSTGARIAKYITQAGNAALTSYALTRAESVGVGIDTYNESFPKEYERAKNDPDNKDKSDEELKLIAKSHSSKNAAFAFNLNQINFFLNLTSAFKFNSLSAVGSRAGYITDSLVTNALNTSKQTTKQALIHEAKDLALEGGQEYIEETVNHVAQQQGVDRGYDKSYSKLVSDGLKDAMSEQGREAGFWGAVGGISQSGFTAAGKFVPMYKNKAYEESYASHKGKLINDNIQGKTEYTSEEIDAKARQLAEQDAGKGEKRVSKHYIEDFREEQTRKARLEVIESMGMTPTEDGKTAKFDADTGKKVREGSQVLDNLQEQTRLFDEYDQAASEGNFGRMEDIRRRFTTKQAVDAITNGTANTLENAYQAIASLTGEQAVEYGITDSPTNLSFQQNAKDAIKNLRRLEGQAIRNKKYVNSDIVTEVDADIMSLTDYYDKAFKDKLKTPSTINDFDIRNKDYQINKLNDLITQFEEKHDKGYFENEERGIVTHQDRIKEQQNKVKEAKDLVDVNTQTEKRAKEELKHISDRIQQLKDFRSDLTSKETQSKIKQVMKGIEDSKRNMTANLIDIANNEDNKKTTKQNKEGVNPVNTKPNTQSTSKNNKRTKEISSANKTSTTPEQQTSTEKKGEEKINPNTTDQVEPEYEKGDYSKVKSLAEAIVRGDVKQTPENIQLQQNYPKLLEKYLKEEQDKEVVVIPDTPTPVVSNKVFDKNLESNPFFSGLVERLGNNDAFLKVWGGFINKWLEESSKRQEDISIPQLLTPVIGSINDHYIINADAQQALLNKYEGIKEAFAKDTSIIKLINNFYDFEKERFTSIINASEKTNELVTNIKTSEETPSPVMTEDEASDAFEDGLSEEPFDINANLHGNDSNLDFKRPAELLQDMLNILEEFTNNGIPINNWNDFYIQLVNASSKDVVNSILPRLKNMWNFIQTDNKLMGNPVNENDYNIDESVDGLDSAVKQNDIEQSYDDSNANNLSNQMGDVVNGIVQSTPTDMPILVKSGTGLKSTTLFKIAYSAVDYVNKTVIQDGVRIDTKQDASDDLNSNNSYELYYSSTLVPGAKLTLIPLGIGKNYRYYNKQSKEWVDITRRSVDKVLVKKGDKEAELLDAVDNLPIFISKSTSERDIIDGAFLHIPEWASTDNMAGDSNSIELQKEQFKRFRERVVFNVNKKGGNKKLITLTINNKSAGIPITSRGKAAKVNSRLTENITFALKTEDGHIKTGHGKTIDYINNIDGLNSQSLLAILPTSAGNIAYPISRIPFRETPALKESIKSILDLFFTVKENRTDKQNKDIETFKRIGLDVTSLKSVRNYLNKVIYTSHAGAADGSNRNAFTELLEIPIEKFRGKSMFRMAVDGENMPYLQFGRIGLKGYEINHSNYAESKDDIMSILDKVLDYTYPNISLDSLNSSRRIYGVEEVDGEMTPTIKYDNYNDMVKDTSVTSLNPKIITNPKTGKDKVIYTVQQTISFDIPDGYEVDENGEEVIQEPATEPAIEPATEKESVIEEPTTIQEEVEGEDEFMTDDDYDDSYIGDLFNQEEEISRNPNDYKNFSGGAKGADLLWDFIGKEYGVINHTHYTTNDYDSSLNKDELNSQYIQAAQFLGRGILKEDSYGGKLVRRDMLQANSADSIIGITELVSPGIKGPKGYSNKKNYIIPEGGTGYALARGILTNKPVYVYNQSSNYGVEQGWYKWNGKDFVKSNIPTLTPNFAGIGTTRINDDGLDAIGAVYSNMFNTQKQTNVVKDDVFGYEQEDNLFDNITPLTPNENGEVYTFDKAISHYTYIPGISNLLQNSVVREVIGDLYSSIIDEGNPMSISSAIDGVYKTIEDFYNRKTAFVNKNIDAGVYDDKKKAKNLRNLELLKLDLDLLKENKDKIKNRVSLVLKQEGLAVKLSGKIKAKYNTKKEKQARLRKANEEAEELGLELAEVDSEISKDSDEGDAISFTSQESPEIDNDNSEDENVGQIEEQEESEKYDKDSMTISPTASLTQELKQFFSKIKSYTYDKEKEVYVARKNRFGLNTPVPFNIVFQKVQDILALYPTENYINPDIKTFVSLLEKNKSKAPYLVDVIDKLNNPATTEDFKMAFVSGMYKMYNNTVFTNVRHNIEEDIFGEETENYTSSVNSLTDRNAVSIVMNRWNEELEAQGILEDTKNENDKDIRVLNPIKAAEISQLMYTIPSSKTPLQDLVKVLRMVGIELPVKMVQDLGKGTLYYNPTNDIFDAKLLNAVQFYNLDIVRYSLQSIVGNPFKGIPGIQDANTQSIYGNSGFLKLARLIASYEESLTSNSARNLNGDMIFNISEVKNLAESFFSAKNINVLNARRTDPYHNAEIEPEKSELLKTWSQKLVTKDTKGNIIRDFLSNFSKSFRYYTISGAKISDSTGNTVLEIEKMGENDHILNNLLMYINGGSRIGSQGNVQHLAIFPYLTMSDKKQPMAFSAPATRLDNNIFRQRLDTFSDETRPSAQRQVDYLYEVMVRPDIRRMMYMADNPKIDIAAYTKENSKFYTLPMLNLIDFDYTDGDINKNKLEGESLKDFKASLGLLPTQNLFKIEGTGANTTRVIDTVVLSKPEVVAYIKNKMLDYFKQHADNTLVSLLQAGIITGTNTDSGTRYSFDDKSKIDTNALKSMNFNTDSTQGVLDFIYDYSVNTVLAYAQMQELLIGDPIQYAKTSSAVKDIKEKLQEVDEQESNVHETYKNGIIDEDTWKAKLDELQLIKNQHRYDLIRASGQADVLSANDNQGKRLAADNASGTRPSFPVDDISYNLLVISDNEISVSDIDIYKKNLITPAVASMPESTEEERNEKQKAINSIVKNYLKVNQADAQEFTTLKEHLNTMVYLQEISREEADQILKDDEHGTLSVKDYSTVLQSMKMVYAESFTRDNINSKLYVKSSSFPLSKTFVKGLPIEKLYNHMINNDIHRAAFKSAVKVGSPIATANIFNKDGSINEDGLKNASLSVIKDVPRIGLKKQQNVPYKEDKHQLNDGTQKAKLMFLNLMNTPGFMYNNHPYKGRELYNEYMDTYREMYRLRMEELRNELFPRGIDAGIDYKKLHTIIIQEAESRGFSENDIAFLNLSEDKANFEFPLWLSGNEPKLLSLLNSIVDNRVRKRKREGISGVLVSDIAISTDPKYKGTNITYVTKDRANQLRSMRDIDGNIIEAEVIVPFRFRNNQGKLLSISDFTYVDADGETMLDMDKIPSELLDIIGFRIPTQGLNSMIAIKIVGFLPEGYDNVVFAPADLVAQMGSDFDVDKLYQDFINTFYEDGKLRRITEEDKKSLEDYEAYRDKLKRIKRAKEKEDYNAANIMASELEGMRGDMSQEDYLAKGRSLPKDLRLKLLEDKVFDIQKAVLMNPHNDVQGQRVQPIDSAVYNQILEEVLPKVYDDRLPDYWSPYTASYQIGKYLNARGGKTGVSTWSSTSVANAVFQGVDYIEFPMYFVKIDPETGESKNLEFKFMGQTSTALNNPKGNEGNLKSDFIQALQSITVDNENLQAMHKLNLNEHTADFIRAAATLGYKADNVITFINHPVIKEYVKNRFNNTTMLKPNNYYTVIKDGENVKVPYPKGNLESLVYNMSKNEIEGRIKEGTYDVNNVKDYAVYAFFMELSKRGKTIKSLESSLNIDSKGIGSNLFYSIEKEESILKLESSQEISHLDKLLGSFENSYKMNPDLSLKENKDARSNFNKEKIESGYVRLEDKWFLPSTLPSMAAGYALVTNNRLWNKAFPYHHPIIREIATKGLRLDKNRNVDSYYTITSNEKSGKTFIGEMKQEDAIGSASPKLDSEVKQSMVEHFKSYLYSVVNRERKWYDSQLVDSLDTVKESNPDNLFFKKLTVEKMERNNPNSKLVVFDAGAQDSSIDNNIVNDIIEALTSTDAYTREYTHELILSQLANGGIQKAKQFVKHIPPHYLKHIGIYKDINSLLSNVEGESFLTQYIQHNPELVASKALYEEYRKGRIVMSKEAIILPDIVTDSVITNNSINDYISMQLSNGSYMLFMRQSKGSSTFIRIPTLGKSNIREYNINNDVASSRFEMNNPSEGWYKQTGSDILNDSDYNVIKNIIQQKLTEGINNPDSEDAIVKVCK